MHHRRRNAPPAQKQIMNQKERKTWRKLYHQKSPHLRQSNQYPLARSIHPRRQQRVRTYLPLQGQELRLLDDFGEDGAPFGGLGDEGVDLLGGRFKGFRVEDAGLDGDRGFVCGGEEKRGSVVVEGHGYGVILYILVKIFGTASISCGWQGGWNFTVL